MAGTCALGANRVLKTAEASARQQRVPGLTVWLAEESSSLFYSLGRRWEGKRNFEVENTQSLYQLRMPFPTQKIKHRRAQWSRRRCSQRGAVARTYFKQSAPFRSIALTHLVQFLE